MHTGREVSIEHNRLRFVGFYSAGRIFMRSRIPFSLILIIAVIITVAGWTFFGRNISAAPPVVSLTLPTTQVAAGRFPFTFQGTILDGDGDTVSNSCLLYTSPSPRDS